MQQAVLHAVSGPGLGCSGARRSPLSSSAAGRSRARGRSSSAQRSRSRAPACSASTQDAPAASAPRSQLLRRAICLPAAAAAAALLGPLRAAPAAAKPSAIVETFLDAGSGRTIQKTASGIKFTELGQGSGEAPRVGDLVMCDVVLALEDGTTILDTRAAGTPIAFQLGITSPLVTQGLDEVVRGMKAGGTRLAVVPAALGYGANGARPRGGSAPVPGNADLYYEIELLRCQQTPLGLACCSEAKFAERGGACIDAETLASLEKIMSMEIKL